MKIFFLASRSVGANRPIIVESANTP